MRPVSSSESGLNDTCQEVAESLVKLDGRVDISTGEEVLMIEGYEEHGLIKLRGTPVMCHPSSGGSKVPGEPGAHHSFGI